jgi:hypothetical protein
MKVTPALTIFLVAAAIFIFSSYIPDGLIRLVSGNMIGAAALLGAILYTMRTDKVLAIAVFLAAAALFLESRRRTVARVAVAMATEKPVFRVEQLSMPAPDLVPGEVHPSRSTPEYEDHNYEPSEESGSNKFEPVGESLDEKQPLETVPPHPDEVSSFLQQKGLASVGPA